MTNGSRLGECSGRPAGLAAWVMAGLISSAVHAPGHAGEPTPMVSVYSRHTLALSSDGKVLAWGADQNGQLGSGARSFETRPVAVAGLANVTQVASGGYFSLAVDGDGAVWAWGTNYDGQLGDGTTADRAVPTRVIGLDQVQEVCAGATYALARRRDGTVWGWGSNVDLTLGGAQVGGTSTPVQVAGLSGVSALACGDRHALALLPSGRILAWGRNEYGALGIGSTTDTANPTQITSISSVRSIAAGQETSLALLADGTVWEWGTANPFAVPRAVRRSPVPVAGVARAGRIAAGSHYMVAIGTDQQAWWQWTTGDPPQAQTPVGELAASARGYGQGFLLKSDGSLLGFGAYNGNGFGNLGDGTTDYREAPAPVADIAGIAQVASGSWHGVALASNGQVWSWGLDSSGQLGRGRVLLRSVPAVVDGLPKVMRVSAGHDHSMALDEQGQLWAWGGNGYAQLGNGTWADAGVPERLASVDNVKSVLAGAFFTLALKHDGSLWGWGSALPPSPPENPAAPVRLHEGAAGMAAGASHILALQSDGSVQAWGENDAGQLGDGTLERRATPTPVVGLSGVVALTATGRSSYALRSDGSVWAWGENDRGQLGDGTSTRRLLPQPVAGLSAIVELAVGSQHAIARRSDGSLLGWAWGYELVGELGLEQDRISAVPAVLQIGPGPVQALAAGDSVSAFLGADGLLRMGGRNASGQIGDGSFATAMRPTFVVDERATGLLDLDNLGGTQAPADPAFFLLRAARGSDGLSTLLTDLRATGFDGEVYFSALLPSAALQPAAARQPARGRAAAATRPRETAAPGMSPVVFTRLGVKQTGPATAAQPSVSGALSAGSRFQVYGAELKDPLLASNAIICMGVTVPELSAKGQVLMRPIATGERLAGVAQCPPVQTPATLRLFTGQASGPITARTITASIEPLDEDRGQPRKVYSWAVAPDGRQFMQTPGGWAAMTEPMQAAMTLTVPLTGRISVPITHALDLSGLAGTLVFIGLGSSWDEVRSLNRAGHYQTVQ